MNQTHSNLRPAVLTTLTLLVALVGCSSGTSSILDPGGPDQGFKGLVEVSVKADALTQRAIDAPLEAMQGTGTLSSIEPERPSSTDQSFDRTMACPAGGEIALSGRFTGAFDRETATFDITGSGSRTVTDCAFDRGETSLTITGSSNWELARRWVFGLPDGLQTRRYYGSWTATNADGQVRSCEFDYSLSFDPETGAVTSEGDMCGSPIPDGLDWLKHDGN